VFLAFKPEYLTDFSESWLANALGRETREFSPIQGSWSGKTRLSPPHLIEFPEKQTRASLYKAEGASDILVSLATRSVSSRTNLCSHQTNPKTGTFLPIFIQSGDSIVVVSMRPLNGLTKGGETHETTSS
jgi:hypothetical protein